MQQVHLFTNHVTVHCWTTFSTTFYQWSSTYPFSDLLSYYPLSSMRCPIKQRLLTHHTNYISLCSIHPHYTTTCFLTTFHQQCVQQLLFTRILFIPCHTLKLFQKLQWGFKLTHNSLFSENVFLFITCICFHGHQILALTTYLQRTQSYNKITKTSTSTQGLTTNLWRTLSTKWAISRSVSSPFKKDLVNICKYCHSDPCLCISTITTWLTS